MPKALVESKITDKSSSLSDPRSVAMCFIDYAEFFFFFFDFFLILFIYFLFTGIVQTTYRSKHTNITKFTTTTLITKKKQKKKIE